jgi:hypothetical protein
MSDDGLKGGENLHTSYHLGNGGLWQRKVFICWCSVARMTFVVRHVVDDYLNSKSARALSQLTTMSTVCFLSLCDRGSF